MEGGGWGPWISHRVEKKCHSDFREDGGYGPVPRSHTSKSVQDNLPELGWAVPLGNKQVGCLKTTVCIIQKLGVCFYRLSHELVALVWFLGKCRKYNTPKPVSDNPSVSMFLSPQQALRCRMGKRYRVGEQDA